MNPSQANSLEHQQKAIDYEIQSLEESIRALRHRRNALAPISSLPPEIIAAIFVYLRSPGTSAPVILDENPDHLAWLRVVHVCQKWRQIALNQPLFWSYVNFTTLSSAGASVILSRAKMAPLHLEARVPIGYWNDAQWCAFQKALHGRVSRIYHLGVSAEILYLRKTLEGLVSPAPDLEYLSLSSERYRPIGPSRVSIPDTLFDGTFPRLSCLELCNSNISWTSPLLKDLKNLEKLKLSPSATPSLSIWLGALDEMPRLKTLILHWATPIAPPFPYDVERTVTLPSLTHLDISASARDCALALAHLVLPALTSLCLKAMSCFQNGGDVQKMLPYVMRHFHGPQDPRPLRSVLTHGGRTRTDILAWTAPDIDVDMRDSLALAGARSSARVALSIKNTNWFLHSTYIGILDEAMAALPLDSLVTLAVQNHTMLDKGFWLNQAPRWPLLQRVRLARSAARTFRETLLIDDGRHESLLFPSLTKLVLVDVALSARRTLRLCDALMKRVEQGVPLEMLDLRTCVAASREVRLLGEIVVDVWGPEETTEKRGPILFTLDSEPRGFVVQDDDSGAEGSSDDNDADGADTSDDDEHLAMAMRGNGD